MSEQLIVTVILKLLDLGIRLSDKPQDVEEYARLRREIRKAAVAEANSPAEDDAPSHDDDEGTEEQHAQDERAQAEAGVEDELAADDEAVVEQNQESDDDEAQASTQPE